MRASVRACIQRHRPLGVVIVEADGRTFFRRKEPAQRLDKRRQFNGALRHAPCFVEASIITELVKTMRDAPHARGNVLRVLLDLIQSLSVHSKFGPLEQLVQALAGCVDDLHLIDRVFDGLRIPVCIFMLAHLLDESGELVACRAVRRIKTSKVVVGG